MGNPFHRGPYAFGDVNGLPPEPPGAVVGRVYYQNGSGSVLFPDYQLLPVDNINGALVSQSGDGITVAEPYDRIWLQMSAFVTNTYGQDVVFGYSWNDGEVKELGRVNVQSNEAVFSYVEREIAHVEEGVLTMYISSSFEWAGFTWADVVLLCAGG